MYTVIPYLYCDAANFKESSVIVLEGVLTEEQVGAIISKLNEGTDFIPGDLHLGIEELQPRMISYPNEDDLVWHELEIDDLEVVATVPNGTDTIPSNDFVNAFSKIADSESWDIAGCMERLDIPV